MKFKLTASIHDHKDIDVVAKELETNLGSPIISISKDISMSGTFITGMVAKKWRLNYRYEKFVGTFWELRIYKRYTNDPWFTNFLLRWT